MTIKDSAKPLYLQVKESLEEDIHSQKYPVGSKLPSEKDLCEMYNVSRITVRQALEQLENKGMIYSIHGKGTFVKAAVIDSNLQKISSFGDSLKHMGYEGYTKITKFEEHETDEFERLVHGNSWNKVCHLSLTGYAMDEPVVLYHSVVRSPEGTLMYKEALELERDKVPFSTFDLYAKANLQIGKINQKVTAVNAEADIAKRLNIKEGDAILVLDSVILDKNMQLIEYKKGYYCTDKYTFNLNREL